MKMLHNKRYVNVLNQLQIIEVHFVQDATGAGR
jgi:hypothetical protein